MNKYLFPSFVKRSHIFKAAKKKKKLTKKVCMDTRIERT